ncbi:MAG: extracellular solute-binding protein [Anaerolineaceae bacterium]|nr:extracellular solute-binding protein [Anaerolineaceae bacterium]
MKIKFVVLMVVALLALGSLSAVVAQDAMGPYTLVMWSQDGDTNNAVIAGLFEQWAAEFAPGSTLEIVQKETETLRNDLQTAGLAGSGLPDFFLGPNDAIGPLSDAGLLQPLDELFDMSMYPFNLGAAQIAGVTLGVPTNAGNHLMLMYNKSLVETAPDTWADLIAAANAVEEADPEIQGFAYNLNEPFWFLPFVHGFGGSTFDEEGNFSMDTEAWVNAYQFVHDLKFVEEVVPAECDYNCASDAFKAGTTAIILNGDWAIGEYLDTEVSPALGPDNLGVAPWPAYEDGNRPQPFTAGKFISIPVTTADAQLEGTVAFVTWLTTDAAAVEVHALGTGRLPAIAGIPVEDPILQASQAALETGVGMPANPALRCMWDSVRPNLEGVMSDALDAATAASESQISAELCLEG